MTFNEEADSIARVARDRLARPGEIRHPVRQHERVHLRLTQ